MGVVHGGTRPGKTFFYEVSRSLVGVRAPGQMLLVPFGAAYRRGWLLDLIEADAFPDGIIALPDAGTCSTLTATASAPCSGPSRTEWPALTVQAIKPAALVLCRTSMFTTGQIALARFISTRYRCALGWLLDRMLPRGLLNPRAGDLVPASDGADISPVEARWPEAATALAPLTKGHSVSIGKLAAFVPAGQHAIFIDAVVASGAASVRPALRAARRRDTPLSAALTSAKTEPLVAGKRSRVVTEHTSTGSSTVAADTARHLEAATKADPLSPERAAVPASHGQPPRASGPIDDRNDVEAQTALTGPLDRSLRLSLSALFADVANRRGGVFLLHGDVDSLELVTQVVRRCRSLSRQTLVLVPENRRSSRLASDLARRFGHADAQRPQDDVAVLHRSLPQDEQASTWQRLQQSAPSLLVGAQTAPFAPLHDLGAIVVLDEHSYVYKSERAPHYHARDVALWLGKQARATVMLVSLTPDPVTYWRARRGVYHLHTVGQGQASQRDARSDHPSRTPMVARTAGQSDLSAHAQPPAPSFPMADVVDLRQEVRVANVTAISRQLHAALSDTLAQGGQALLLLNRRGARTQLLCARCGYVARCAQCSVPLTYHAEQESLQCHYCNGRYELQQNCPQCPDRRLHYVGVGTQRVEAELKRRFPQARIGRWDRDASTGPKTDRAIIRQFRSGALDVLVGTQLLASRDALPRVTLVGVVNADVALYLPDYRAAERTFFLLHAMRRAVLHGGRLLVQTYSPEHWAVHAAATGDVEHFYREELRYRRELKYPPYTELIRLLRTHPKSDVCQAEAVELAGLLRARQAELALREGSIIGPAPAYVDRIRGRSRWQIFLRGRDAAQLLESVPRGWSVDVNPISSL